ncbi:sulfite exporter TauE/SafE family protein [Psychroflexus sp. CAK57W]|uniref:sulfite exporter TauE/SafE family protein n=1 Tax=Psychroflexus curvus TaxID=2873595 RepID=UPI001CCAD8DB|nr:sulfite exporter TauE/SafE family protein [Psychroflexus curvus]MBZ9626761.1 sulfite exporter TauE/SafE family protein [Psychroflexus curvus]MBZ9786536.1 sulfite exporter TauE/SafE family protein [Psychroflexus curvus]
MVLLTLIALVVIGLLAGFLSGVLGVGGGVVMVPLMVLLLGFSQHQAQGTSLAVLAVPVTLAAAYNYYQDGSLNWKYALVMASMFVIGGYLGSKLAISLDEKLLRRIFGVVLVLLGFRMIFSK